MAALAIPIVVLGSLYILSEQEKKNNKENFIDANQEMNEEMSEKEGFNNYNPEKITTLERNVESTNQHTDRFFNNNNNNSNLNTNIQLMNGEIRNINNFKHNNMQPFFGGKIKGATNDYNLNESILDNKQGLGSQNFRKNEQKPLFSPNENMNLNYGTPNNSDFFQSRMNESMKMSNVTLWEPQRVAPGLGLGYGNQDDNGKNIGGTEGAGGFNSSMTAREQWMPKNVDELRTLNNQKNSYNLDGHQGPANSIIKTQGPNEKIGTIEKHLPEKYYASGPQRWFTTTGVEQAPTIRSTQVIPMENRIDTTREYYGSGGQKQTTYTNSEYEDAKRQQLGQLPISNATLENNGSPTNNDYGNYTILPNNRVTDNDTTNFGGAYGMAKAIVTPILDILNPTRKENIIGNLRQSGNFNSGVNPGILYNKNDKTKVTNREMTTGNIDMNYVNINRQTNNGDAYKVTQHQNYNNQRTSTNQPYIGNGSSQGQGLVPYNSAYSNERNNVNKSYELHNNHGNTNLFNNYNNMETNRNDNLLNNNRANIKNGGPSVLPGVQFIGEVNGMQSYNNDINKNRMDPHLLDAFKNNPYTQSLSSVA